MYDLVYGVTPDMPEGDLVVDYDARRLAAAGIRPSRCAELADLADEGGPARSRICLNVLSHTAKAQWQRDLAAAARLLGAQGVLVVRAPGNSRVLPSVRRALLAAFERVERSATGELRAGGPRVQPAAPAPMEHPVIQHRDPLSGRILALETSPGLFAHRAVDPGSELLLSFLARELGTLANRTVLDVGCGYGAIGCTLAARGGIVTLLDSDLRAVRLARANLARNALQGTTVIGDAAAVLPPGPFDLVVSNPPTHAGSEVLQRMFDLAGTAGRVTLIVVRAHLHYEKWLRARFRAQQLTVELGYKIIQFEPLT